MWRWGEEMAAEEDRVEAAGQRGADQGLSPGFKTLW